MIIGVIGDAFSSKEVDKIAENVGENIAKAGCYLISGGLSGVMEAACRGAKKFGGTTIGILPGFNKEDANPFIDIPVVTGLDQARNIIVVRSSDGIIAISGGYGTLSEISFALKLNIPLVGINTWEIKKEGEKNNSIIRANSGKEAVELILKMIKKKR